jgi:sterol 3beta-glucosyltransferase
VLEESLDVLEGADAVVYSLFALAAYHVAEKLGIPSIPGLLQPMNRTTRFPLQPPPYGFMKTRFGNRLTFIAAQQLFGQAFKGVISGWRKQLGLKPLSFAGFFSFLDREHLPVLYGYSPVLVPKPADWGPHLHVTGYWFLDRSTDWQPPQALLDFLESGDPPVYVGFGSMASRDPQGTAEVVIKALKKAGKRGVLMSGWGALRATELPDDVYYLGAIPHDWLFPRLAAVVHHGGAGTTGAGLRSGVPSFAVPFFGDQFFWGDRLARLGVGPRPIPHGKLTVDNLSVAIRKATTDEAIKRRASVAGERVRAENGVERAVHAFEQEMRKWTPTQG